MSLVCSLEIKMCIGMLQTMLVPFNIVGKLVLSRYNEKQTSFC